MTARVVSFPARQEPGIPPGCPDLTYIREHVPIARMARLLGIRVLKGYRARCWRTENHQHADADPSLSFQVRKNRWRCWICDEHTSSNIDLVMSKLGFDLKAAVKWIAERFPVPALPDRAHIGERQAWFPHYRAGTDENVMTLLIKSGIWADLSHGEQAVLAVLLTFTDTQTRHAEISYPGLMRYAGVGSRATVARAIRTFERMRVLRTKRSPRLFFRGVNVYTLTLDDPQFDALLMRRFTQMRQEIAFEKEWRAQEKKEKQKKEKVSEPDGSSCPRHAGVASDWDQTPRR